MLQLFGTLMPDQLASDYDSTFAVRRPLQRLAELQPVPQMIVRIAAPAIDGEALPGWR